MICKSVKFFAGIASAAGRGSGGFLIPAAATRRTLHKTMSSASTAGGSSGGRIHFRPVVMSGPSGSGKSTLVKKLMAEFNDCFAFSVSHTTRSPRPGEVDGKDYYFVSQADMTSAIANNNFIEHATFSGNTYGTSKNAVENVVKTGRICILDIDMQGVKSVKNTDLNCRFIFVKPPNEKVLEERLRARGTECEESLQKRLAACKAEMEYAKEQGAYDHIVVNDDLEVAYEKLKGILIKDIDTFSKDKYKAH